MRIVFAGTPDFAAVALRALLRGGHQVVGVYTQPDRPAGRGRKQVPGAVKQVALEAGLPVFQPTTLKTPQARDQLAALEPDVMVVAAYGLILPPQVLSIPRHGCLNIHASLLPRWRGAAPIQRAIAAGDRETGITIMQMDAGLDTGDMLLRTATPIHPDDTGGSLHDRLADMGGEAILTALDQIQSTGLEPQPQDDSQACYAAKLHKEEGHIDWHRSADAIARQIRAFTPWPGNFADIEGQRIRVHQARVLPDTHDATPGTVLARQREGADVACGDNLLRIQRLQLPGARPQSVSDLINGGRALLLPGQELH